MAKREPAANILAMDITNDGKIVRIVRAMCGKPGRVPSQHDMRTESFVMLFSSVMISAGSPQQQAALIKLHDLGWVLSKIVQTPNRMKMAFSVVHDDGCVAWVTPDGKMERAAVGKRTAYLSHGWEDVA